MRWWKALFGVDPDLAEAEGDMKASAQRLHESTLRLQEATGSLSEKTIRIWREDAETRREIERLGASDGD